MKRLLKILVYIIVILLLFGLIAVGIIHFRGVPSYPYNPPPEIVSLKVEADSTRIERGAKIASMLCIECHMDKKTDRLTGQLMLDMPKEFGKVYTYNITHDKIKGIGAWTDGELYYFLRTGIRSDGSWSPPFMPKFPLMADEDIYSIISWLRSDDPLLQADSREYPQNQYNLFVKFLSNVAFKPPSMPSQPIFVPDSSDTVVFGEYVANSFLACYACHSADLATIDFMNPEKSTGFYGGGNPMLNLEGEVVPTANITMDKETGIGTWSIEEFRMATKYGMNPRGGPLYFPMFPHAALTDTEVDAIYAYLQTVPPIHNKVERYKPKD